MAQTKRIALEPAPETLPEDFSEWDGERSSATLPAESKLHEVRGEVSASRERAQTPVTMIPVQRTQEKAKTVQSRASLEHDEEVDAFLRRLNEVNADQPPARRLESSEATRHWPAPVPAQGTAAARQEPEVAARTAAVDRELIQVFRSGYQEIGQPEPGQGKKSKWVVIGAVSVLAVTLAITIPVVLRGRSVNLPRPAASPTKALGIDEGTSALKPSPAGKVSVTAPSGATSQKPAAVTEQTAVNNGDADQAPVSPDMMNQQLNAGSQLPQGIHNAAPADAPPPSGFGVAGLESASDSGEINNAFKGQKVNIGPSSVKVSAGVAGGLLIHKTPPQYPTIAKTARVSGTVVLSATISRTGRVQNLQVVSGPAMLRQAALDAVRSWLYKPYLLNNQPTEVQTTINVDFSL